MFYATIDCGTTNSRVYIVDENGRVYGKAAKRVGVRDTAVTGSKKSLLDGIKETIANAVSDAGIEASEVKAVFSSGMITSEVGLYEIPHLTAPCGTGELAENITLAHGLDIVDGGIPVYFVRGVKNDMGGGQERPSLKAGELDFMRGEETQIAGLLARGGCKLPVMVVILSSHTKFVPVDENGNITGSLTTMSGQMYDAILNNTFVGKSVEKRDNAEEAPPALF
jgi:2-dehydro-3-deoxygalactonokinase